MATQKSRSIVIAASDTKETDFCSQSTFGSQKRFSSELGIETESKKLKFHALLPSPDLFDDDDDDGVSMPQDNDEQNDDDNDCVNDDAQCDGDAAIQSNSMPFENPLVPNVWATPPNEFHTQSHHFCSEELNITAIVAGLCSQTQATQIEQQRFPSLQEQEPEPEPTLQQQPASDVSPKSPNSLSADELIEELSQSFVRVNTLIDEIKESS